MSALLSRQVQHHTSTPQANAQPEQNYAQQSNQVSSEDDNIEDQLRNFTQRLRHSKPDGTIPAPEASHTNEHAQFEEHTSLEAEQMAERLQSKPAAEQGTDLNSHVNQQDF